MNEYDEAARKKGPIYCMIFNNEIEIFGDSISKIQMLNSTFKTKMSIANVQ